MTALKGFVAAAVLACAAAASVPAVSQSGPSFNCRLARTFVEKAICRSPSLSAKDQRMANAYRDLYDQYEEGGGRGSGRSLRDDQRRWLAQRNRCQTVTCLHRSYDRRIRELEVGY